MEIPSLNRKPRAEDIPLERLTDSTQIPQEEKVREVARQFEAVLLRQILTEAQKPHFKSKYDSNSSTSGIYQDMITNQLADGISRSSALGLGDSLKKQLSLELNQKKSGVSHD